MPQPCQPTFIMTLCNNSKPSDLDQPHVPPAPRANLTRSRHSLVRSCGFWAPTPASVAPRVRDDLTYRPLGMPALDYIYIINTPRPKTWMLKNHLLMMGVIWFYESRVYTIGMNPGSFVSSKLQNIQVEISKPCPSKEGHSPCSRPGVRLGLESELWSP